MTSRAKSGGSCGTGQPSRRGRGPAQSRDNDSLEAIVDDCLANEAYDHAAQVLHYGNRRRSLRDAVWTAACSIEASGNLHGHQRRIGKQRMRNAANVLGPHAEALANADDFEMLLRTVEEIAGGLDGIGELAIYDMAERIGMYLGVEPQKVYLHSGTLEGARELFPNLADKTLELSALPPTLRRLTAAQIENLLCIYKERLQALRRAGRLTPGG